MNHLYRFWRGLKMLLIFFGASVVATVIVRVYVWHWALFTGILGSVCLLYVAGWRLEEDEKRYGSGGNRD